MTSTTYPNGQTLQSSALTISQINIVLQNLTCGMIGVVPPNPALVRIDWPTQGQPFVSSPSQDVVFLSCVPTDVEYNRVRDLNYTGSGTSQDPLTETWLYTRGWRIAWTLYGPNSTDRARMIRSALFIDYFNDQLSLSNLYPVQDAPEVVRIPEQLNAQWYERADFHIDMYEQVTETITDTVVTSVEMKLNVDDLGQVADITVNRS